MTSVYVRRREMKHSQIENHVHRDLHIGGYTKEEMLHFAGKVLTAGNNVALNRFFGIKKY